MWIKSFVLMPDHMHCCIWVNERLPQSIKQYLTKALIFSQREAEKSFRISGLWSLPAHLFMCYTWEVFQQKIAYNEANVARWKMDHFQRTLSHPHLLNPHPKLTPSIAWQGFGHLSLLDEPHLLPCYISSSATPKQIDIFTRLARGLLRDGWGFVGGFVSPQERALLTALRTQSNPAILHVAATRLPEEKVPAQLANALTKGRFLRITSAEERETCTRELCVWHNLWIETLCLHWRRRVLDAFCAHAITPTQKANLIAFLQHWPSPSPASYHGPRALP